jgi:hypothetical protein
MRAIQRKQGHFINEIETNRSLLLCISVDTFSCILGQCLCLAEVLVLSCTGTNCLCSWRPSVWDLAP